MCILYNKHINKHYPMYLMILTDVAVSFFPAETLANAWMLLC